MSITAGNVFVNYTQRPREGLKKRAATEKFPITAFPAYFVKKAGI